MKFNPSEARDGALVGVIMEQCTNVCTIKHLCERCQHLFDLVEEDDVSVEIFLTNVRDVEYVKSVFGIS